MGKFLAAALFLLVRLGVPVDFESFRSGRCVWTDRAIEALLGSSIGAEVAYTNGTDGRLGFREASSKCDLGVMGF